MSLVEEQARMACTMAGHNPDALWNGHYAVSRETGLRCDQIIAGRAMSLAWRAYTDPPQFRGTIPEPSIAELVAAAPPPETADPLQEIATQLRRIADWLITGART